MSNEMTVDQMAKDLAIQIAEGQKSTEEKVTSIEESTKNLEAEFLSFKEKIALHDANTDDNQSKMAKSAIVNLFKSIKANDVSSEEQFQKAFDSVIKETYQNTTTATDGAEFVFEQFERDVYAIFEQYPLLNELNTLRLLKGKKITLPRYDGGVGAYFIGEGSTFTASKADTGDISVDIYKLGALVTLTDEMLEDDMTTETLYNLILQEVGVKFANKLENEVLNGDGTYFGGILANAGLVESATTATKVTEITDVDFYAADGLIDEKYDINPSNKVAIMKKSTRNALITARDSVGGNLLFPDLKSTNMIGDYRIVTARSMPTIATGAVAILVGNVKDFYYHVSRKGFTSEMGYLANDFRDGKKSVRCERRDGGEVKDINAFVAITMGTVA